MRGQNVRKPGWQKDTSRPQITEGERANLTDKKLLFAEEVGFLTLLILLVTSNVEAFAGVGILSGIEHHR